MKSIQMRDKHKKKNGDIVVKCVSNCNVEMAGIM